MIIIYCFRPQICTPFIYWIAFIHSIFREHIMAECVLNNVDGASNKLTLLDRYEKKNTAYFSSPNEQILAYAPFVNLLDVGIEKLNQQVSESLRFAVELGHENAIVIGAIPFDTLRTSSLRLSTKFHNETIETDNLLTELAPTEKSKYEIKTVPNSKFFMKSIENALDLFSKKKLDKVVLSRTLEVTSNESINVSNVLKRLKIVNPTGYTFAVPTNQYKDKNNDKVLVGASPELLIKKVGNKIIANPLAGSEAKQGNLADDERIIDQLMNSKKDSYEHELVVKSIVKALQPLCHSLNVPKKPSIISTQTMWHLSTIIEGELKSSDTSSLEVALAMHPTPAIGGYPTKPAIKAIEALESHDRNLFTGMVGWSDANGDGEWVVTIRCAEIDNYKATLYAGAGIVEGSIPEKELAETGAKFNTMLDALGADRKGQYIE